MRIACAWPVMFAVALALNPGRAEAQHRYGRGFGGYGGGLGGLGGFGLYYYSPAQPERLLYRQATLNASRATMGPVMNDVYDGRPAAYIFHLRDPGYLDGMDVATRRRIEARIGRFSDGPPPPEPRPAPAPVDAAARAARREQPAPPRAAPAAPGPVGPRP